MPSLSINVSVVFGKVPSNDSSPNKNRWTMPTSRRRERSLPSSGRGTTLARCHESVDNLCWQGLWWPPEIFSPSALRFSSSVTVAAWASKSSVQQDGRTWHRTTCSCSCSCRLPSEPLKKLSPNLLKVLLQEWVPKVYQLSEHLLNKMEKIIIFFFINMNVQKWEVLM